MYEEWVGPVILGAAGAFFFLFLLLALRRARQRRREEFADTPLRVAPPEPEQRPEALVEDPQRHVDALADALLSEQEAREEASAAEAVVPEDDDATERPAAGPAAEEAVSAPGGDEAMRRGLAKTQASLLGRLNKLLGLGGTRKIDPNVLEELEEALLTADVGVGLATRLMDELRERLTAGKLQTAEDVREALKQRMQEALAGSSGNGGDPLAAGKTKPWVILFVGVNGVGKTTTIGKIAAQLKMRGLDVVMAAGDTFRAAAVEQLAVWGERTASRVVRGSEGSDPASVLFMAIDQAKQTGADVVLADTAGRLHTKTSLMDEIKKVKRVAGKARQGAPDETWLVVDATTGQNALQQAREFDQALGLTGIILTKLDGTAKGGVVVAIADALRIPVRFVGVGEGADDLRPFSSEVFISALFATQ
jgi:fused signal recognition particle receptor